MNGKSPKTKNGKLLDNRKFIFIIRSHFFYSEPPGLLVSNQTMISLLTTSLSPDSTPQQDITLIRTSDSQSVNTLDESLLKGTTRYAYFIKWSMKVCSDTSSVKIVCAVCAPTPP